MVCSTSRQRCSRSARVVRCDPAVVEPDTPSPSWNVALVRSRRPRTAPILLTLRRPAVCLDRARRPDATLLTTRGRDRSFCITKL
jgi:hypothetical protein